MPVVPSQINVSQVVLEILVPTAGAPVPTPTPTPTTTIVGGGPPALHCPKCLNCWDLCLLEEIWKTKRIQFPPLCSIPEEYRCRNHDPWDDDYNVIPPGAVPFHIFGTITTPAAIAGDVQVCQGRVPQGYDGLLYAIYQMYQGSGFTQGSGDIVWRVRRNQIWVKQLGNNPYAIGTNIQPFPLTEGEILFSGTLFSYFVNVPNLSASIQVGASKITCGMMGFYWPR